jgi:hypothetical protein
MYQELTAAELAGQLDLRHRSPDMLGLLAALDQAIWGWVSCYPQLDELYRAFATAREARPRRQTEQAWREMVASADDFAAALREWFLGARGNRAVKNALGSGALLRRQTRAGMVAVRASSWPLAAAFTIGFACASRPRSRAGRDI